MNAKRRTVIAGNWKMNFTPAEATAFINEIKPMVAGKDNCDIIFCAPYVTIAAAMEAAKGSNIKIGAENVHFAPKGAYTGEVSAEMLKAIGVDTVIIGHSERRQYFGETDETVNLRTKAALAAGMRVILCMGEVKEQRVSGITNEVCAMQIKLDLAGISAEDMKNIIIAYEPVWAIGTGLTDEREKRGGTVGKTQCGRRSDRRRVPGCRKVHRNRRRGTISCGKNKKGEPRSPFLNREGEKYGKVSQRPHQ